MQEPAPLIDSPPSPPPPHKKKSRTPLVLGVLFILSVLFSVYIYYFLVQLISANDHPVSSFEIPEGPTTGISADPHSIPISTPTPFKLGSNVENSDAEIRMVYRPEMKLLIKTLELLQSGKTLPDYYAQGSISASDFSKSDLYSMKEGLSAYNSVYDVPGDIALLFEGEVAKEEIQELLYSFRDEYIVLLRQEGVSEALLVELDTVVAPKDRDHLWVSTTDDRYSEYSFVRKTVSDKYPHIAYSESYMRYEMGTAYVDAYKLVESGILGVEPSNGAKIAYWKKARELGMRYTVYHELTHALQIAYTNMLIKNNPTGYDQLPLPFQSTMNLSDASLFWNTYTTPFTEGDNYTVSQESQAATLAQYLFVKHVSLTKEQSLLIWDYMGGGKRLDIVRADLAHIKSLSTVANGNVDELEKYSYLSTKLEKVFEDYPDPQLADFLQSVLLQTSVEEQSFAVGYAVPYSEQSVRNFLKRLKSI